MNQVFGASDATDEALRDASRRFLTECASFEQRQAGKALSDPEVWLKMAELGWFALATPDNRGGLGGGGSQLLMLLEEAGRALATAPLIANIAVVSPVIARSRQHLVEQFMAGQVRFAFVHSDSRREELRWTQRGSEISLIGTSAAAFEVDTATHLIVAARHADSDFAGLFCLAADTCNATRSTTRSIDGRIVTTLEFDGQCWSSDEVIVDVTEGADALCEELMDRAAAGAVAEAYGAARAAFDLTLGYLKQRVQFGKPLSSLQAIQHMMADAFCSLEQQRSLVGGMTMALDSSAMARRFSVSAAKAFLGGRCREAVETCIQLSGGIGVTDEYVLGHYYKRLLVRSAMFGDADSHLSRIASDGRKKPAYAQPAG